MSNMRGLTVFISDLRNARARDLEEKRINTELAKIRSKFHDTKLSGYDRKKYVCKLLYMYILGWDVEFGHLETVTLISSTKYSEKQIGYLGVTLFLNEHHDLLHLVVNSIRKDMLDGNELFNCLALHCIANIGGREIGEALSAEVHKLLISPSSKSFVKKKAALTLLRLYKRNCQIIQPQWRERLIALIDDPDLGVALSITSLVSTLAQDQPEDYVDAYRRAVHRLKRINIDQEYDSDYVYYNVPIPWLQIKLMQLLQLFPTSKERVLSDMLVETLRSIIQSNEGIPKNTQQSNAQNAVLFQAIGLAIHIDGGTELVNQTVELLAKFISSKETNIRYLGLETMSQLASHVELMEPLKQYQTIILHSLKDRDISVRRRGLDLLYSMCDPTNAKEIVNELIRHLQASDYTLREEMVLKIAILVEKYTTEYTWYITITLKLLAIAGDYVADEVWQRIIQIVANNEALQEHAARSVMSYMRAPTCHENLVKVGGFVLGEFGHLIVNDNDCSPIEQFSAIHSKFNLASSSTRAMLFTTYVKFVNLFPEIKDEVLLVFVQFSEILDPELQQRACEYLALIQMPSETLLQAICDEMPPYPERASKLISKLYSKGDDQVTSIATKRAASTPNLSINSKSPSGPPSRQEDFTLSTIVSSQQPNLKSQTHLSANWKPGFTRLTWKDNGLLFEDAQLRVLLRSEYHEHMGRIVLYFANKSDLKYTSFTTNIHFEQHEVLLLNIIDLPQTTLDAKSQTQQMFEVKCLSLFQQSPTVHISYLAGALQTISIKLPVVLNKFMKPESSMDKQTFLSQWNKFGASAPESQQTFFLGNSSSTVDLPRLKSIIHGHGWGTLDSIVSTDKSIAAASMMHTLDFGSIGLLMRLDVATEQKSCHLIMRGPSQPAIDALLEQLVYSLQNFWDMSK